MSSFEAKALARRALEAYRSGDFATAEAGYRSLLEHHPDDPKARHNLGMSLRRLARPAEAEAELRAAVRLDPAYAHGWNGLGALLAEGGRTTEAEAAFRRALELAPGWGEAARNLGRLLLQAGSTVEAVDLLERAVGAASPAPAAYFELGAARALAGDAAGAIEAYQNFLKIEPHHPAALVNLGHLLVHAQRRLDAGRRCFERALEIEPRWPAAHLGLAEVFRDSAPLRAAEHFERARALDPRLEAVDFELIRLRAAVCDWSRRAEDVEAIPTLVDRLGLGPHRVHPFHLNRFPLPPELHRRAARLYCQQLEAATAPQRAELAFTHVARKSPQLRVGYLSSDFRQHAVGELVRDLFRHHDRDRIEVVAYSLVNVDDAVRRSIEAGCDRFADLFGVSDPAAARRIHEDGIDILVDLSGYTVHARPRIPALGPAPVQVHWLGYLDTLGSSFTPWILADPIVLPRSLAELYDESVAYLPDAFTAASPITPPDPADREVEGLPRDGFVFCNFCHPSRLGPATFDLWMRILGRVPSSVLWLFDADRKEVRENLAQQAEVRGIAARRLVFASKVPRERFLARLAAADLFLDTLGYNAGATGVAALGVGLPLLTCPGETFLGRMGASLTRAAGVADLTAPTLPAYEEAAVELASDAARLAAVRQRLQPSPEPAALFDLPRFARSLESAFEAIWRCHLEGERPRFLPAATVDLGGGGR